MTFILVVHHDADLYGADQSLLRTVRALRDATYQPIVVLPYDGPLVAVLRAEGFEVHLGSVGKLSRQALQPLALPRLLWDIAKSVRVMSRAVAGRSVALAYTNTVAVVGCGLWALIHGVPRLWHVREIVVTPKVAAAAFPLMLRWLGGWCVCNSQATRQWIVQRQPALAARSSVIWNGVEARPRPAPAEVQAYRAETNLEPEHIVVTLVGRINRWKGQGVLIEAARLLKARGRDQLRFLIVGDVFGQEHHFREAMLAQIRGAGLEGYVIWQPFTEQVDLVWAASQIAVAPSTDPEPFGRVAIEAMAHGLPVIATGHGGLAEIVEPQRTGLLVPPGDAPALADAIDALASSADLRQRYGAAGLQRQAQHFTQTEHDRKLIQLIAALGQRGKLRLDPVTPPHP